MNEKGIDQAEWRPLHAIDKARLSEARLQAHYAAQWLARVARAYVPPQPGDGHTSLSLDRALEGFVTHSFKNGMRLSLQVTNLSLTLRDRDGAAVVESIFLNGRSDSQVRQSLGDKLSKLNLDARALDAPSPYEIPAHAIRPRESLRRNRIRCRTNGAGGMVLQRRVIARPYTRTIDWT
jgi:hypothetical protein